MKKAILLIVFALSLTSLSAQKIKEGNLDFLIGEKELNLIIDYKNTIIHGNTEEAFVNQMVVQNGEQWKEIWDGETKTELYQKFTIFLNRGTENLGLKAGTFPEANYVAVVKIINIEKKGTTTADVFFLKTGYPDILAIISVQGDGGKYGSMENLAGDGFRRAGSNLGQFLANSVKVLKNEPIATAATATIDSFIYVKPQQVGGNKPQPAEVVFLSPKNVRQLPRATLKADAGYGWRIVKINPDLDEFERNIVSNLLHGFAWNANFDYFFKDKFGVRVIFSQYRSTYNTMAQNLNTGQKGTLNAKDAITYIGPAFVFRQPFAQNKWLLNAYAGYGYIEYRQNTTFANEYEKIQGASLGSQIGIGLDCKIAPNIGIGINILITYGTIQNFKIDVNGITSTEKVDVGGEGLLHIKLGAGIRYYIK